MANEVQEQQETAGRKQRGTDPELQKQRTQPLDGEERGVSVKFDGKDKQYLVGFEYSPALVAEMRRIEGATFDKDAGAWRVPVARYDALAAGVEKMRVGVVEDAKARAQIEEYARSAAAQKMHEQGNDGATPRISDFLPHGKPLSGEIISVNGRYAAQLTGFGREDGAAFVTLHRLSELSEQVFKGDKVSIAYNEKGQGQVQYRQTLEEKLDESLGKYVDGVKVIESEGRYKISFDYNPALNHRIQRVDGAEFDREERVWAVPGDKKAFVARAVNDMRKEVIADRADREQIEAVAREKIDGAKVKDAFTKDGTSHTGKIVAANDRYVLQHTGKEYGAVHRADALSERPEIGRNARITYEKGKGLVGERTKSKDLGHER